MGPIERPRRIVRGEPAAALAGSAAGPLRAPRERYRNRGERMREAVNRLDARLDERAVGELLERIRDEYPVECGDVPVGLFSRCRLGPPHVDHRLDLSGGILEHFTSDDIVPAPFSGARMLVRTGGYAFVEVYGSGLLLPVRDDGTVVRP
jgi:hypothetical protein